MFLRVLTTPGLSLQNNSLLLRCKVGLFLDDRNDELGQLLLLQNTYRGTVTTRGRQDIAGEYLPSYNTGSVEPAAKNRTLLSDLELSSSSKPIKYKPPSSWKLPNFIR